MPNNKRIGTLVILILGVAILGLGVTRELTRAQAPGYEGHSVDYWVKWQAVTPGDEKLAPAFRGMGIQTAPFILAARKRHEAPWYRMYKMRWRQSQDWVKRIFPEPWRPVIDNSDAISLLNLYGREVIPIVTPYLKEHHAGVRYIVFQTLLRLHIEDTSNAHKLFPYFSSFLGDPDEYLRTAIVIQLGEAGHAARDAVPALLRAALDKRSGTPWFRTVTAIALGRIGNPTGDVLSSLRVFLQDADGDTGVQAAIALWKIDRQITNTVLV